VPSEPAPRIAAEVNGKGMGRYELSVIGTRRKTARYKTQDKRR